MSTEVEISSEVTCYTELIAAIDAERVAIGVRHLDFEVLAGMAQGHWGKATGMLQAKKLGIEKIFDVLRAAGLRMRIEVDPKQREKMLARISEKFNPMNANQARNGHASTPLSTAVLSRVFKVLGRNGRKKRWAKKSKQERSEHMRMMINARWKAERKRRAATHRKRRREKTGTHPSHCA